MLSDGTRRDEGQSPDTNSPAFDYPGVHYSDLGLELPNGLPWAVYDHIVGVLLKIERGIHWAIGDALNYGESIYGEMYAQVVEASGLSTQRLYNIKWVCSTFPRSARRQELSFAHHEEVASIRRVNAAVADEILQRAVEDQLPSKEVRNDAREARRDLGMEDMPELMFSSGSSMGGSSGTGGGGGGGGGGGRLPYDTHSQRAGTLPSIEVHVTDANGIIVDQSFVQPSITWLDEMLGIVAHLVATEPDDHIEMSLLRERAQKFVTENGLWDYAQQKKRERELGRGKL